MARNMGAVRLKNRVKVDTLFMNSKWNNIERPWSSIFGIGKDLLTLNIDKVATYSKLLSRPIPTFSESLTPIVTTTIISIPATSMESV